MSEALLEACRACEEHVQLASENIDRLSSSINNARFDMILAKKRLATLRRRLTLHAVPAAERPVDTSMIEDIPRIGVAEKNVDVVVRSALSKIHQPSPLVRHARVDKDG